MGVNYTSFNILWFFISVNGEELFKFCVTLRRLEVRYIFGFSYLGELFFFLLPKSNLRMTVKNFSPLMPCVYKVLSRNIKRHTNNRVLFTSY